MHRCDKCGREDFKSERGLTLHSKRCKEIIDDVKEVKELDYKTQRRLAKLRDQHKCCADALTKYNLECEIRILEGN